MSHYPFDTPEEFDDLVDKAKAGSRALNFLQTVAANLDNMKLTDEQFRDFIRDSLVGFPRVKYTRAVRPRPPESKL